MNRPGIADRPNIGGGNVIANRPGIGNRPNIGNNVNVGNRPININQNNINNNLINNRPAYVNRPVGGWYGGAYRPPYWGLHNNWYHGGWGWTTPAGYFAAGTAFGWLMSPGATVVYANPYYVAPPVATTSVTYLDYSQPIAVEQPAEAAAPVDVPVETRSVEAAPANEAETAQQAAVDLFDKAQAAFGKGGYERAQTLVEEAIAKLPKDATLHEFRALTLFAQKKYQESAGAIYAVLAAGPGWDWETLKANYPDLKTYQEQLRDLENFQKENPTKGFASLLLAYHYLTLGHMDAAKVQLRNCAKVEPKDQLAPALLAAIEKAPAADDKPKPGGP